MTNIQQEMLNKYSIAKEYLHLWKMYSFWADSVWDLKIILPIASKFPLFLCICYSLCCASFSLFQFTNSCHFENLRDNVQKCPYMLGFGFSDCCTAMAKSRSFLLLIFWCSSLLRDGGLEYWEALNWLLVFLNVGGRMMPISSSSCCPNELQRRTSPCLNKHPA